MSDSVAELRSLATGDSRRLAKKISMPQNTLTIFDCSRPAVPIPIASFSLKVYGDGLLAYDHCYLKRENAFNIDPWHLFLHADEQLVPCQLDGTYGILSDIGPNA